MPVAGHKDLAPGLFAGSVAGPEEVLRRAAHSALTDACIPFACASSWSNTDSKRRSIPATYVFNNILMIQFNLL